jgi:V/A-type H+-transporting ATPase subunit E
MLLALAKNYNSDLAVVFSDADKSKLTSFVTGEFAKELGKGVKVESDKGVKFGFRIKLDGGKVTHEFTEAAMADALSALLRPQLARVVNAAAQAK